MNEYEYDFFKISTKSPKRGIIEIYPKFRIRNNSKDLMIRGRDFYAVWLEDKHKWSTNEQDVIDLIDNYLDIFYRENRDRYDGQVVVQHMEYAESGIIDTWHKYCQKQMRDTYTVLDQKLIFSDMTCNREDYSSKTLSYPLVKGSYDSYDKIISTLYSPEERNKLEWAIGSIVTGDSKTLQKFVVLYGEPGKGKSTVIKIVEQLFSGYVGSFDAKSLGSSSHAFSLEAFSKNPLVAVQHEGDLSKIDDNTRLNSLVSHETLMVNEKFKSAYPCKFNCFLFMGTNSPVKITDSRSGLMRRLIDISPTGNLLPTREYEKLMSKIKFELSGIAYHCMEVYQADPHAYDKYTPLAMLGATNDFYDFMVDNYYDFLQEDSTTLAYAFQKYQEYCDKYNVDRRMTKTQVKEELKAYFSSYAMRGKAGDDRSRPWHVYTGFKTDKFIEFSRDKVIVEHDPVPDWLKLKEQPSLLDILYADCPAQYAKQVSDGTWIPNTVWDSVTTTLKNLDTSKIHYILPPDSTHIVMDFDIKDESGNKSYEKNIEAASKFTKTYAETSKSDVGIHLHYIYDGDPSELNDLFAPGIEIKVFTGKSSLRRKLTKCNDIPMAHISSGLPLKEKKVINENQVKSQAQLVYRIKKALNKEYHNDTSSSINFINKLLNDAYESGIDYDVSDLARDIKSFAANSTNQSARCRKVARDMKYKAKKYEQVIAGVSDDIPEDWQTDGNRPLAVYDVEVYPNLFILAWVPVDLDVEPIAYINPDIQTVSNLFQNYRTIGFNNRKYDDHICYAHMLGYSNKEKYLKSKSIIERKNGVTDDKKFFPQAYKLSYLDLYECLNKKQSLKKWEIELAKLGLTVRHQEMGLDWNKPVPEELWPKIAGYCKNDVLATKALFLSPQGQADYAIRRMLIDIDGSGLPVRTSTNRIVQHMIFGDDKNPQKEFNYRDLGGNDIPKDEWTQTYICEDGTVMPDSMFDSYTWFDIKGRAIFPGYKFENGVSTYRGLTIGEGGFVAAKPGYWENIVSLDGVGQHPCSIFAENLFGDKYTAIYKELYDARVCIKHGEREAAAKMMDGRLAGYLKDDSQMKLLSKGLKIPINAVYGQTFQKGVNNPFRDERNVDNIVAKRSELFMINLMFALEARGVPVIHIKTDSVKLSNPTPEIIQFVKDYGRMYGYFFEQEAFYKKFLLKDKATYIGMTEPDDEHPSGWEVKAAQFAEPYVYKKLLSKEEITFDDLCQTKEVSTALYLDFNESLPEGDHAYEFVGRIGLFCPVKDGTGGGELLRQSIDKNGNDKYSYATGAKGHRWREAETIKERHLEDDIDISYFEKLVEDAVKDINKCFQLREETQNLTYEDLIKGELLL